MKEAEKKIVEIIKHRVNMMNRYRKTETYKIAQIAGAKDETIVRLDYEVTGMLICLKNIKEDDEMFYCINYLESGYEFGYYKDSVWHTITK